MDHTLSQIFRHLTHELNRPLASLQQSVYLLLDEVSGPLTVEQRRILEIQLRNAKRVSSCITNLGDLAQLEAGIANYELASHDLAFLIEGVMTDFKYQSNERGIKIRVDLPVTPPVVQCDKDLICRAIGHVLENAIKFSPPGGTIRIGVQQVPQVPSQASQVSLRKVSESALNEEGYVVVSIADSGPGIAQSEREAIFQRFYQIKENAEAYQQGLGIGLTLCRGIVEAHHGAVWVDDNPGGGSLVSLLFPVEVGSKTKTSRVGALAKST